MRITNKNKYKYTMKTTSGKFIAMINRRNLSFFASGFNTAESAHRAAMIAVDAFEQKKDINNLKMRMGHAFGHHAVRVVRFAPVYGLIQRTFTAGECCDGVTRRQVREAIEAAQPPHETVFECIGCGAEYAAVQDRCDKCSGTQILAMRRLKAEALAGGVAV